MSIRLSCPSCNHMFALPALPEHRRATCPRCGDVFPIRTYTEEADDNNQRTKGEPETSRETASTSRSWLGLSFAFGPPLLLVFGLVLVVCLIVAFKLSVPKVPVPQEPSDATAATATPWELSGLGYLRPSSNIVFAMRPGPLLSYAERTQQQPNAVLAQTGLPEPARGLLDQLGVPPAQIDHLAGGIELGEGENSLRLTLVLVLREALADEGAFLKALKAQPVGGKKSRHDVTLGRFPLLMERVSPTVWVFGLDDKDFTAIEGGGHGPGGKQFRGDERSGVRGFVAGLPQDAAVWAVADDDQDWTQKPIVKLAANSPELKKWLPAVRDGRGGSLAVSLGEQPRVQLRVRATDAATGERVRAYFAARAAEVGSAKASGEGAGAQFEAPFDPATTGKLLQRFLSDAGR